jgi:hypothetical protein
LFAYLLGQGLITLTQVDLKLSIFLPLPPEYWKHLLKPYI